MEEERIVLIDIMDMIKSGSATKISDDELDEVVGGFGEANSALNTAGMNIICPSCSSSSPNSFSKQVLHDPKTGSLEYRCKCGCRFVCYEGYVIPLDSWISRCAAEGYKYPFE